MLTLYLMLFTPGFGSGSPETEKVALPSESVVSCTGDTSDATVK